jgi:hypothetical protein
MSFAAALLRAQLGRNQLRLDAGLSKIPSYNRLHLAASLLHAQAGCDLPKLNDKLGKTASYDQAAFCRITAPRSGWPTPAGTR